MAADSGRSGSLSLHPLVLVNVSDHLTRAQFGGSPEKRVLGVLFGCQSGLSVHVFDSFEVEYSTDAGGSFALNKAFVEKKREHFSAVFPTYELLGWYTVGSEAQAEDMAIHRAVCELNESPLLLLVDPNISAETKELPVKMYESVMQVINDVPTMIFVDVEFQIEATEPERITVDQIVKGGGGPNQGSSLLQHLGDLHNSVEMLTKRMRALEKYLLHAKSGDLPRDHAVLREIASICNRLPVMDSAAFQGEFESEFDDTMLISYLAAITKGAGALGEVQRKVNGFMDGSNAGMGESPPL